MTHLPKVALGLVLTAVLLHAQERELVATLARLCVVDEQGHPVAGARVRSYGMWDDGGRSWDARTNADGRVELPPLVSSRTHTAMAVTVDQEGFGLAYFGGALDKRGDLGVMVLSRGTTAHGMVHDAAGQPIADALIALVPQARSPFIWSRGASLPLESPRVARTGLDGSYELPFLPPEPYLLVASAVGYSTASVRGGGLQSFVLKRQATMHGQVVDAITRRPLAGACVNGLATSDAAGHFVTTVDDDEMYLTRDGYMVTDFSGAERADDDLGVIGMRPIATINGGLRDPNGNAMAQAMPWLSMGLTPDRSYPVEFEPLNTRSDGTFTMRVPAGLPFTLRVIAAGATALFAIEALDPGAVLRRDFVFAKALTWSGRVLERGSVQPVAGALVTAYQASTGDQRCLVSTSWDGHFTLTDLLPEDVVVCVSADHHAGVIVATRCVRDAKELALELDPETFLEGRVLDDDGQPLAGAKIILANDWPEPWRSQNRWSVETDRDGRFRIGRVGGARVMLTIEPPSHARDLDALSETVEPPFAPRDWTLSRRAPVAKPRIQK